jgi:squalene-hopene/tetraprenyl-beta-curcumene cyclase
MNILYLRLGWVLAILCWVIGSPRFVRGVVHRSDSDLISRIDLSLDSAAKFLADRQSEDGAWRSHFYGPLKDGPSLTPQVMASLEAIRSPGQRQLGNIRRGGAYLSSLLNREGRIDAALRFPSYTAAVASRVVMFDPSESGASRERDAWIELLRAEQLNGALGWLESDACFGGWGYAVTPPHKPGPGESRNPFAWANMSATVFCLDGLRAAGIRSDDPAFAAALIFVERCQNFSEDATAFDDGGFFFTPNDAAWNKAGRAGIDGGGRERFHSYGAPTADGLRALLDCGLPLTHPRVMAARHWLESHFDAVRVSGSFEPDREVLRNASYYYFAASASQALLRMHVRTTGASSGPADWPKALASEILRRQGTDGSWVNQDTDAKEDDPLVATPAAMMALHACRLQLTGRDPVPRPSDPG